MPEPCACASWEGTGTQHVAVFPDTLFDTLLRDVLGDYHGATPHQGRLRCRLCGSTFAYVSELTSTVVTRESDVDRVIAAMRAGNPAQVGGGRCFSTYEIRDGRPLMITSDDGFAEEIPISEARLREVVEEHRKLFLEYLELWRC